MSNVKTRAKRLAGVLQGWTDEDANRAAAQGWDLFAVERAVGRGAIVCLELQRCDEVNVFESDAHAYEHVLAAALSGDPTAVKAILYDAGFRHILLLLLEVT